MEMSGQPRAPTTLLPGWETRYPLTKKLDGPQGQSGRCAEELHLLPLPGIKKHDPSAVEPLA
jgi:hypothetical protein